MHGRPRQRAAGETSEAENDKELAKVAELQELIPSILHNHRTCCYTKEALMQNAKLLELNPEFYTAWNFRKRAVQHLLSSETDEEARKRISKEELDLVYRALKVNHKSYGAWHHRKWVIALGLSPLDSEFTLLSKVLKLDARNFHSWNYRRFAVRMKGVPIDEELQFTTEKINENFSNYSAWHNRSALLSELYRNETGGKEIVQGRLEEEFDLVKNSFFTDPNDQSAWFYYSWLLGQVVAPVGPELNGSWPPHTSELVIKCSEEPTHLSITCTCPLQRVTSFVSSGVPLLLSFTEAVTGVNNETVTVHSNPEVRELSKLSWRPVGFSQEFSQTWATEVRFQIKDDKTLLLSELTNFTVDIEVAVVPGIVSPGGQPMQGPVKCSKVYFHFGTTDNAAKKTIGEELMAKQLGAIGLVEEETSKGENQTQIKDGAWQVKILETEIESILELLKIEPDSKWAQLTLIRLLTARESFSRSRIERPADEVEKLQKLQGLLRELTHIDLPHSEYYQHEQSLLILREVVLDLEWPKEPQHLSSLLNLRSRSLYTLGCFEHFLWVQHLDLSNNHLRSTHGFEALQLLENLNISHNQILSFTALAPLALLPLLRILNISFNEIGAHPVDTCRNPTYLGFENEFCGSVKLAPFHQPNFKLFKL
ncbi:hypothetical protein CY35_05G137200 [Sphagnum magellanicum]|nr:hypothetical protein CY35_05G137200 [Sphagnum magellanicum]